MCIKNFISKKFVGAATVAVVMFGCGGGGSGAGKLVTEVSPSDGGTVSRDINQEVYPAGTNVTLTAEPAPWHKFKEWTGAVSGDSNTITVATVGNMKITAVFEKIPHFTDSRDGKTYRIVDMPDGKTWMAENLNYETSNGSWCYHNSERNCNTYGRLYDWNTAQTVCPEGWRLPNPGDWILLVGADLETAGTKLKSTTDWNTQSGYIPGTDDFGFSALPGGYGLKERFMDIGSRGYWWTSERGPWEMGIYFTINNRGNTNIGTTDSTDGVAWASVRCIRD